MSEIVPARAEPRWQKWINRLRLDPLHCRWNTIMVFLAPALVMYLGFTAFPVLRTFYNSFHRIKPGGITEFVGLANFIDLFSRDLTFFTAVKNTMIWATVQPCVEVGLGLLLALCLYAKVPFERIFRVLWFTPVLLSFIPVSEKLKAQYHARIETGSVSGPIDRFLSALGRWLPRGGYRYVAVITVVIVVVGFNYARQIKVGDFFPGSSILWPFHRYNKDAFRITFTNPLLNPLYVILEGEKGGGYVTEAATLREMNRFQRYINRHERVMFTLSIVNPMPGFLMVSFEDDPQWFHMPKEDRALSFMARKLVYAGEPGTWDQFVDMQDKYGNIIVYCRDKMPSTVDSVINHIEKYLEKTPGPPGGRFLLAGGAAGVQAAVCEVIEEAQIWNLILALGGVFLICAFNFRSLTAGLILTIPLAISNLLTFALMGAYHIGLTVNTYPVASVGIGLGVDYGIYFMSRILEERKKGADLNSAVSQTLASNGRAIIMIATTLTLGLMLWIFSSLKFQAEMGVLLAILLFLNMLGALLVVPALICILKPKFITRVKPDILES
jgi:predicted RND superfamily exporter protein